MDNANNSESTKIIGFHGTDAKSCKNILRKGGNFYISNREDEWAGTGVYFFIEETGYQMQAYENAYNWSKKVKKVEPNNVRVIQANMSIDSNQIFDLRKREAKKLFHAYRNLAHKKLSESAQNENRDIKKTKGNGRVIDCKTINKICAKLKFQAVIVQQYINFTKYDYDNCYNYPSSIPNCSVLSLRNQTYITDKKEVKKEDVNNGL